MTREAEQLFEVAAKLSPEERARLAVQLLDSIASPEGAEAVAEAQGSESRSRLDAARAGDLEIVDDEDAMRMIAG